MGGPKSPVRIAPVGRNISLPSWDPLGDIRNPERIAGNIKALEGGYGSRKAYEADVAQRQGAMQEAHTAAMGEQERMNILNERAKSWGFAGEEDRIKQVTNIINAFGKRRGSGYPAALVNIGKGK